MDFQAFLITFREVLEALLIVGIITTYLRKINETRWHKWVWLGVFLGFVASCVVALVFQVVFTGYGTMASQIHLKYAILFASTILLTHMILFMAKQFSDVKGRMESKITHLIAAGSIANMVLHSFLVVLREGVETVFFFAAISGGDIQQAIQSWGALLGMLTAIVVSYLFFKSTRRIPLGSFFKITGIFLVMVAAGLLVQGIGVLQDLKIMGSLYKTAGGEVAEVYNLEWFMPEHPLDEDQYIRDTGNRPMISGQVGIFMKAFMGYSQAPSLEEFLIYWAYYVLVLFLVARVRRKA